MLYQFNNMNLILGSSGKIGSYYKVFSRDKMNFYTSRKGFGLKLSKFDFTKQSLVSLYKKKKFSKCVIFSSISDPKMCFNRPEYSHKINVKKMKNLINFLIEKKVYFIFFSSEYIFSGKKIIYNEKNIPKTKMVYGNQKILIEKFIKKKKYKNCLILRISKVYGNQINDKTLFSTFLKEYNNGKRIFKVASDQYFRPLYVKDLIKIIDIALKNKLKGIYNISGNSYGSRYSFIKKFIKYLKIKDIKILKIKISEFDDNIFFPKKLNLSNLKIKKKIKFKFTDLIKSFKEIKHNVSIY